MHFVRIEPAPSNRGQLVFLDWDGKSASRAKVVGKRVTGDSAVEFDMAIHGLALSDALWTSGNVTGGTRVAQFGSEFATSILIEAKNDTDTNPIALSVASGEDQ